MTRTRKMTIGALALLVVGGAGGAIAATQLDTPAARSAAIVSDAAQQLGVQPSALTSALEKAEEDQIDSEVSTGDLTQSQGDAMKAAIASGQVPLIGTPGIGGGFGHVSAGIGGFGLFGDLDAAATYLGLTGSQIASDLRSGQTLADLATAQGKTADGLVAALVAAEKSTLDGLVSSGKLSADQETQIESNLEQQITSLVNGTHTGPGGGGMGFGHGRGGFGAPGGAFGFGANLDAAATYLGLTTAEIQSDLQSGKTLADIATAQGKTADGLVSTLVAAETSTLEGLVSAGTLTADQETAILSGATQRITDEVNGTRPSFGGSRFGGLRGHFGRGNGPGGGSPPSTGNSAAPA
jgi:hypothetical protein